MQQNQQNLQQLQRLTEALQEKSLQINLFSAGDREKLLEKHIPDSLAVQEFWCTQNGEKVLDLGTGGGLPGLVLAIVNPQVDFTLMDSREKKIKAVMEVAKEMDLENCEGVVGRFEELAHDPNLREKFDKVVARAVAELPVLLEYAAGFLRPDGKLYAWKGSGADEELLASKRAQEVLGMNFVQEFEYELEGMQRKILLFKKVCGLDEKYPRRTGIPKKKVL
jgi:16S rRNA (guanine527-N7)-methyltransferase